MTNEYTLIEIAKTSCDVDKCIEAINIITDEEALAEIAIFADYLEVCEAAFSKIKDPSIIRYVLSGAHNRDFSKILVSKIKDTDILLDLIIHPIADLLDIVVNNFEDENILKNIVEDDKYSGMNAIKGIYDQNFLVGIIVDNYDSPLAEVAVSNIKDDEILINLFLDSYSRRFCYITLKYIKNQDFLYLVATEDRANQLRLEAIKRLTDENYLKEFLLDDDFLVRKNAVEGMSNTDFLKEFIIKESLYRRSCPDSNNKEFNEIIDLIYHIDDEMLLKDLNDALIKENYKELTPYIINNITDESILYEIFKSTTYSESVYLNILKKINNIDFLKEIVKDNYISETLRINAIGKINDDEFLKEIIKDNQIPRTISKNAIKNISSVEVLKEIAKNQNIDDLIRKKSIRKTNDTSFLTEIAKDKSSDPSIRCEAIEKINNQEVLKSIFSFDEDNDVLKIVVEKTHYDDEFLIEIINSDLSYAVRKRAYDKINDENLLEDLCFKFRPHLHYSVKLKNIPSFYESFSRDEIINLKNKVEDESLDMDVRLEALSLIYDLNFLKKIYHNTIEKDMFFLARKNLEKLGYKEV